LNSNYPNPFNPETNISFSVTNDNVNTSIDIYNIRGEKVNTIVDSPIAVGSHTVVWNGTDNNGKSVSSGVYFMKMKSGKFTSSRKLILMK
jgi:flagellar hook assembly protein FlgD